MHWSQRPTCSRGHEYTPANTYLYKRSNGSIERKCRTCHRDHQRQWARPIFNLCARCGDIYGMHKWEAPWLCDGCREMNSDFLDNEPISQFCVTSG